MPKKVKKDRYVVGYKQKKMFNVIYYRHYTLEEAKKVKANWPGKPKIFKLVEVKS